MRDKKVLDKLDMLELRLVKKGDPTKRYKTSDNPFPHDQYQEWFQHGYNEAIEDLRRFIQSDQISIFARIKRFFKKIKSDFDSMTRFANM
jgi:hypothetical protein